MLTIDNLTCGYRKTSVLRNFSMHADVGECVCLIGPNGAGKSTLVHNVTGLYRPYSGEIVFDGARIDGLNPEEITRRGIALVPEGRRIFTAMTVEENLALGNSLHRRDRQHADLLDQIFDYFPILEERRYGNAGKLSGGEQQMLAISRALLMRPKLLIIDEPSLGLAPLVVSKVYDVLSALKARGDMAIVIVEQSAARVSSIADRAYVLSNGEIAASLSGADVSDLDRINAAYFGPTETAGRARA